MTHKVGSMAELEAIISAYSKKGTATNNYVLAAGFEGLIQAGAVYAVEGQHNLILLVDRNISYQVYFYVNDFKEAVGIASEKPLMMEMVYRGSGQRPESLIDYWQRNGFKTHLTRDNLILTYDKKLPEFLVPDSDLQIKVANTEAEAAYAADLFERDLDRYTGDLKTFNEILTYVEQGNVLCAYEKGYLCGTLQFEIKNNTVWLGHIAVDKKFRGKGIAYHLVNQYIEGNAQGNTTRYQLWVIQENAPAVKLYQRFGFVYAGKSTVSMLKL